MTLYVYPDMRPSTVNIAVSVLRNDIVRLPGHAPEHSEYCRECLTEGGCVITARTADPDKACGLRRARAYHIVIRECLTE